MKRTAWLIWLTLAACHAHSVQEQKTTLDEPPKTPQVSSARPVRTTPGGMLDATSMKKIQAALGRHGVQAPSSGHLDEPTEAALRKFQEREKMATTGMPDYDTLRRLGLDPKEIYLGGAARASSKAQ